MDDLRTPNQEQAREFRTEERLRSYPSDVAEAWGIVLFAVVLVAMWWAPPWMQLPLGGFGVIGLAASIGARLKRKRRRGHIGEG